MVFVILVVVLVVLSAVLLATGRQPGGSWKKSDRKSLIKIQRSKGGVHDLQGPGDHVSPPLISRFLVTFFHHTFPEICRVAFQWPVQGDYKELTSFLGAFLGGVSTEALATGYKAVEGL